MFCFIVLVSFLLPEVYRLFPESEGVSGGVFEDVLDGQQNINSVHFIFLSANVLKIAEIA